MSRRDQGGPAGDAGLGAGGFTHLDGHGRARMVDVTTKPVTARRAVARCVVRASIAAIKELAADSDLVVVARSAGSQAAKLTSQLVPLCHPLPVDRVEVRVSLGEEQAEVLAEATVAGRTGVEMEALTACGFAGLSLLSTLLVSDPDARLCDLALWHKSGGRSGTWDRAS